MSIVTASLGACHKPKCLFMSNTSNTAESDVTCGSSASLTAMKPRSVLGPNLSRSSHS